MVNAADKSLLATIALYFPLGILLFAFFIILRRYFPPFYCARRHHGYPSPPNRSGFFGWISPTLHYTERDMVATHGLDAVMVLRVARTCLALVVCMFLFSWLVIAPVNAAVRRCWIVADLGIRQLTSFDRDPTKINQNPLHTSGLAIITMSNIDPNRGKDSLLLIAHTIGVYLFTIFALYLLYIDWKAYTQLRIQHLSQRRIATSSILVASLGLPSGAPLDESENAIAAYMSRLFPNSVSRVVVAAAAHPIRSLMAKWNKSILKMDKAERKEDEAAQRKIAGKKAQIRQRVDMQQQHLVAGKFAIVTMRSRAAAAIAENAVLTTAPDVLRPRPAPDPHDVDWTTANVTPQEQRARSVIVFAIATVLVMFWAIPVGFAGSLANISYLSEQSAFEWLRPVVEWSPTITGILTGILPPLVVWLCFKVLYWLLHVLAGQRKLYSHSDTENTVRNVFFAFQFVNVILVYTLWSTFLRNLKSFLNALSFNTVVNLLAVSLPPQATFFSTYLITAAVLDQVLNLFRPGDLVLMYLKMRLAKTPREKEIAQKPPAFDYAKDYTYLSLIFIICLSYSLLSPLITLWALLYFALHYISMKHNLLYSFIPRYEAGGKLWPSAFTQLSFGVVFFQILMFGVFLTYQFAGAPAVLPLIPITIILTIYMRKQWEPVSTRGALERFVVKPGAKSNEEDEAQDADPAVLHEGDYAQPERQRLQEDLIDLD